MTNLDQKLGAFQCSIYDQIIDEFPHFDGKTIINTESQREFDLEELTYHVANKMWDTFDDTLIYCETKEE